ncbi:MAG: sugar transferase [Prevotella sp.]|nr:sugar transferase [Prevotella sp.]
MKRRVEKDIWYIEHWSFWLDIQIIMKTIGDMFRGDKKAY